MDVPMRVLVTGADGFVGRVTVAALTAAGWDVTASARRPAAGRQWLRLNLAVPAQVLALQELQPFGCIVHLGARVGLSGETDADLYAPNVLATGCLAQLTRQCGAMLIFASSVMVHGARAELIDSAATVAPDTAYARSKWLGEELIRASGARHCILRIAGVFGAEGPSHLYLNRAIASAQQGTVPTRRGEGLERRNYVYVHDVANAIVHAAETGIYGTHLLGGTEILSIAAILQMVSDRFCDAAPVVATPGVRGTDQVVTPSHALPRARSMYDALADVQKRGAR